MTTSSIYGKSIVSIEMLNKENLQQIFNAARHLKYQMTPNLLENKLIASCFFEPSTRTRLSFEAAVYKLGGNIIGFSDTSNTSTTKGETIGDTMRIISSYVDLIIMRHPQKGSVELAKNNSSVPIINAGDGANQHPTQTLLDLFSIQECQKNLEQLKIGFIGDLKYSRTVHSLALAMKHYDNTLIFCANPELQISDNFQTTLTQLNIKYDLAQNIEAFISEIDILYVTRIQKERHTNVHLKNSSLHKINLALLKNAKKNLKVLHPLPRVDELCSSIDKSSYAYYFEQAKNGLYIRQALMSLILCENVVY